MTDREIILARIREALTLKAPLPGAHDPAGSTPTHASGKGVPPDARQWLPAVPTDDAGRWDMFQKNALALKAAFHRFKSMEELHRFLAALALAESWRKIGVHAGTLTDAAGSRLGLPMVLTAKGYDPAELESCDAGITECDALVAQTGSVMVTSRSAGGRALSVLPPHHVVLARQSQLVPDLPRAFEMLQEIYRSDYPSMISFITGPSRTGDIERILVLGAHGPKKLTILCMD